MNIKKAGPDWRSGGPVPLNPSINKPLTRCIHNKTYTYTDVFGKLFFVQKVEKYKFLKICNAIEILKCQCK